MSTVRKEPPAASPAAYDLVDITAMQALANGTASKDQQQRALRWIVEAAAGIYDADYRSDEREHVFVSGRRFVGLQIVKLLKLDAKALSQAEKQKQGRKPSPDVNKPKG